MSSTTRLASFPQPAIIASVARSNPEASQPADLRSSQAQAFSCAHTPTLKPVQGGVRSRLKFLLVGTDLSTRSLAGRRLGTRGGKEPIPVTMAISMDRPLESTVETMGTHYDEDPPDMPGLKKSNERFRLPHITDIFPEIIPRYSTFSTKTRQVFCSNCCLDAECSPT